MFIKSHMPVILVALAFATISMATRADQNASAAGMQTMTVAGSVVDPSGRPVNNAIVYAATFHWTDTQYMGSKLTELARTRSDQEGRFTLTFRNQRMDIAQCGPQRWEDTRLVAVADGFGPDCIIADNLEADRDLVFRLAADEVPIDGRIVDLQGRPIVGVHVSVKRLHVGGEDKPMLPENAFGLPKPTVTNAEGRFHISGLGSNRSVVLEVLGPTVAKSWVAVETRNTRPVPHPMNPMYRSGMWYGATFEFAAEPTQPVVGTIRDADSKEPLAGVEVRSSAYADASLTMDGFVTTRTDKDGRFRLIGMPQGGGHLIRIAPDSYGRFRFDGIPPGKDYAFWSGSTEFGTFAVKSGTTVNLGDVGPGSSDHENKEVHNDGEKTILGQTGNWRGENFGPSGGRLVNPFSIKRSKSAE